MHCQICFHPTPEHYADCPVLTGEPQPGYSPQDTLARARAHLQRRLDDEAIQATLARGAEPYWMQDIRIAQKRLESARAASRPEGSE